jgi:hypothetical protein
MNNVKLRQLSSTAIQALEMTAEAVNTDIMTEAVVPKQQGDLERNSFVDDSKSSQGNVKIVSDMPYARRLYYHPEYNFRKDKNRNAQGKWFQPWINGSKKNFAKSAFKKFYRALNRGVVK